MPGRGARCAMFLVLAAALPGAAGVAAEETASAPPALSGTIRDGLGAVLQGAEILLTTPGSPLQPRALVTSDGDGRFRIVRLAPGIYRLAAVKPGYLTFVGMVNTEVQNIVDVVLQNGAAVDAEPDTQQADPAWALRLPRRSILQDSDPVAAFIEAMPPATASDPMRGRFEQRFDVASPTRTGEDSLDGSETRMQLASVLGNRGHVLIDGRRETAAAGGLPGAAPASREAADFSVGLALDAGRDSRVDIHAYYNQRDAEWGQPTAGPEDLYRGGQRSWGYDAAWSIQLDKASSVALQFDYQDARVASAVPQSGPRTADLNNRTVGAAGIYSTVPDERHKVEVEFGARFHETPLPLPGAGALPAYRDVSGLTLGIDARDEWQVGRSFSLLYGLGYKHAASPRDASVVVPRLGGQLAGEHAAMRVIVSYNGVASEHDPSGNVLSPFRPAARLGYEADVAVPLWRNATLSGGTRYTPVEFELVAGGALSGPATFVSDGNAAVKSHRMTLSHDSDRARSYVEWSNGWAEGSLAAVLPYEIPFHYLAPRTVRFVEGQAGLDWVATGTLFELLYRKVEELPVNDGPASGESRQDAVELRLRQKLLRSDALGTWRLLMAVRLATLDAGGETTPWTTGDEAETASLDRVSAGVSVAF